jgi:serine/threonine protein phosphatase 1
MKRKIVIGDIHGCFEELQELLERIGFNDDDQVISVGDAVDRGPDSPGVIRFFQSRPGSVVLVGNHERKHIRNFLSYSQQITRAQLGKEYASALAWMNTLPYFWETEEAIVVHAALAPGVPMLEQRPEILCGCASGERMLKEITGEHEWYELYHGAKPVIFGHRGFPDGPLKRNGLVFGIDTNACRGGFLTAVVLPEFQLVSVKARANHWQRTAQEWRSLISGRTAWNSLPWDQLALLRKRLVDKVKERSEEDFEAYLAAMQNLLADLLRQTEVEFTKIDAVSDPRAFALVAKAHPLAPLLFKRRRRMIGLEDAQQVYSTPAKAIAACARMRNCQGDGGCPN